jgi:RNA polymerase sigma-70 factor (ECF subfamily)
LDEQIKQQEPLLRAYVKRRVRRPEDVEDYIQEVYARVLAMPPKTSVLNWQGLLRRVAANLIIDRARRAHARAASSHFNFDGHREPADDRPTAEESLVAHQRLAAVADALKELSPVARSVFLLVRVEGMSYRTAAERLGVDVKAAYRYVEHALNLISRRLADSL